MEARWATADEKTKFVERVRVNEQGLKQKKFRPEQAWEAARDPLTYLLFFMYFSQSAVVGGLNTFNQLLINQAFGFDVSNDLAHPLRCLPSQQTLTALLVSIPLNLFQVCLYFLAA